MTSSHSGFGPRAVARTKEGPGGDRGQVKTRILGRSLSYPIRKRSVGSSRSTLARVRCRLRRHLVAASLANVSRGSSSPEWPALPWGARQQANLSRRRCGQAPIGTAMFYRHFSARHSRFRRFSVSNFAGVARVMLDVIRLPGGEESPWNRMVDRHP